MTQYVDKYVVEYRQEGSTLLRQIEVWATDESKARLSAGLMTYHGTGFNVLGEARQTVAQMSY